MIRHLILQVSISVALTILGRWMTPQREGTRNRAAEAGRGGRGRERERGKGMRRRGGGDRGQKGGTHYEGKRRGTERERDRDR